MNHRRSRKAYLLIEVLFALSISATCILAAGHAFCQLGMSQRQTEYRWMSLLACRTILERATVEMTEMDTTWTVDFGIVQARAGITTFPRGEVVVVASASCSSSDGRMEVQTTLSRLIWPGNDTDG